MYSLGQPYVHSCCELASETLVVVTCGELLAMYTAGTLKGKVTLSVGKVKIKFNLEQATKT